MAFTSGVYDFLKKVAQLYLPAAGTLYFALAQIWNLPAPEQVGGTVIAVDTFLGIVLGISSASYNKTGKYSGTMNVTTDIEGKKTVSLELEGDPYELDKQSEVTFKVNKA